MIGIHAKHLLWRLGLKKLQTLAVDLHSSKWPVLCHFLLELEARIEAVAVVGELDVHSFFESRLQFSILYDKTEWGEEEPLDVSGGVELFDEGLRLHYWERLKVLSHYHLSFSDGTDVIR